MTVAPPPSRLHVAQQVAAHLGHPDFDEILELLSPDVSYRVVGNHALAGTFRGPDEVIAHVKHVVDWTGNTYDPFKWEDWLVGEHHVAALVRVHAHGHGAAYAARLVMLFGFDPADKVSEITICFEDTGAAERFFGR
jgi:ketosteroid isomerase-like protein